jgi:hypothetical protein
MLGTLATLQEKRSLELSNYNRRYKKEIGERKIAED